MCFTAINPNPRHTNDFLRCLDTMSTNYYLNKYSINIICLIRYYILCIIFYLNPLTTGTEWCVYKVYGDFTGWSCERDYCIELK